ncbi:MAG TPA: homocysteine S-methyltransferase family protein [Gaiellaceae bacterium]|nr:homocysteine S-methyltransferase family protein [Gaiellaceae bacterium]
MAADRRAAPPGLLERLERGPVICAEGYLFEFERRGYLQAGAFVPEVVLEHPELVAQLHREFVHAGSDVVEAFTYYGHREKLRIIGKEELLEPLNRQALALAKEVADETGTLAAGDICNTNVFEPDDDDSVRAVRMMFEEQVGWAAEAGVDFVIAETISHVAEALLALETIKAAGLPAVVTIAVHRDPITRDGWTIAEACKRLEDAGADVVGVNCIRGPETMLSLLGPIRDAVAGHVAALPVPYRTHEQEPTFQALRDPGAQDLPDGRPFPTALEPLACNRYEIAEFGRAAFELGVHYLGVCCGNAPHYTRSLAEALGRTPPASRYSPDMSKHAYFGSDERLKESNREFAREL